MSRGGGSNEYINDIPLRKWINLPSVKIQEARPVNDVAFSPAVSMLGHVVAVAAGDVNLYNLTVRRRRERGE